MKKKIPVIYVHRGGQQYLKNVIKVTQRYNEEVVLIGTKNSEGFCQKWIDIDLLNKTRINKFKSVFKNYSPNTYKFEYGCFEKYFMLLEYVEKNNIENFVLCDSDNLVYYNMTDIDYKNCDVMLNGSFSDLYLEQANCSFWRKNFLIDFVQFIENIYNKDLLTPKLKKYGEFLKEKCDGQMISDMTLLQMWKDERKLNVYQMSYYKKGELLADHNVNCKEDIFDFDVKLGIKKLKFINKVPYYFVNGIPVQTICIHCQGMAKEYIYAFSKYRNSKLEHSLVRLCRKLKIIQHER